MKCGSISRRASNSAADTTQTFCNWLRQCSARCTMGPGMVALNTYAETQGKIANWWIPDQVHQVSEVPLTATGKIAKRELRKQLSNIMQAKL